MQRAIFAAVILAACNGEMTGPREEGRDLFRREVVPVLEKDCGTSACHAASDAQFDELNPEWFYFAVDDNGHISGADRIQKAYEKALAKLSGASAEHSDLIRKPLDEALGGLAHRGGSQYRTMTDPNLVALLRWADVARPTSEEPLPPLVQLYADTVQPVLKERRCMTSSCHGASAANSLIFDPGYLGSFDHGATMRNYKRMIFHMNLETPDPMMARIVRKNIPQSQGGIFHRGGNNFFEPSAGDAGLQALLDFMDAARRELGGEGTGRVTGLVFAASDPTPRHLLDISAWQPGGDIYSLVPAEPGGTLTNLTAAHHTGEADVRDPHVSYDGRKIVFSMRRSLDDCLNIYVMNLDGSDLRQLTHDTGTLANGIKVSNVEPLWGPDDRIYFLSTRVGVLGDGGFPVSNIWRMNADGSGLLRMTFSQSNEVGLNWRFAFSHKPGNPLERRRIDLTFTTTRNIGDELHGAIMRVPPDFFNDYHPHFGTQNPEYEIFTQPSAFPDDREVVVLMDSTNQWLGGALAIIDRNLGPTITDDGSPAVVNYVDSVQKLAGVGDVVSHRGPSPDGYYRDPLALPDGRVVVSHSPAPIDHSDPNANPDPALYRLILRDLPPNRVVVDRKELLVDIPGKVESAPAVIMNEKWREYIGDPLEHLQNDVDWGTLLNFDLAVGLQLSQEISPSNTKPFEALSRRIKFVRLVEDIPFSPADFAAWPTDVSSHRIGRGPHGMRRVLAELPATSDRSLYLKVPAGVPFYLQVLDESRMAIQTFNQQFFVLPGEKLKQVTRREVYDTRCGACHGSISGVPGETLAIPDVLTEASRVVANYDFETRTDKPPQTVGMTPEERIEVDFERDVQPILASSCATSGCHVAGGQAPNLEARAGTTFSGAYEALTAAGTFSRNGFAYVDPVSSQARTSYLAEVIAGRDLDAPRAFDSQGCSAPARLTLAQAETLFRWMDLGARFVGIGPTTRPDLPRY